MRNSETRGLAYFVLGYQEYAGNAFDRARTDLHLAVETDFRETDLAEYYEALADQQLKQNLEGTEILYGLSRRFPQSAFRLKAATLLANLLDAGHANEAVHVLKDTPGSQGDPDSLLTLAKAYEAESDERQAAKIYERIYYDFPLTLQAGAAELALDRLSSSMGAAYPQVSEERQSARADRLFLGSSYERALNAYSALLEGTPHGPMADQWQLDRARCLLALRHYDQAAETLLSPIIRNPTTDAGRLRLLVRVYERADDEPSMLNSLDQLYRQYPLSSSYADALYFAGDYFSRHGFWQTAARYYQRLAQSFPNAHWAPQAAWWVTWYTVLEGKNDRAAAGIESYLQKYPSSFHIPAAVYWLGRIREKERLTRQAQALYELLARRFPNSYYGLKAREELRGTLSEANPRPTVGSGPPALATPANLKIILPAIKRPILDLPEPANIYNALNPVVTLTQLGLRDVAKQILPQAIQGLPRNPDLFLALARLQSEGNQPALALFAARSAVPNYQDYPFHQLPKEEWELLYPRPYWKVVRACARLEGLNPYLVMGLIRDESAFDPQATSLAGARGLMQMRPGTAAYDIRSRWRRRRIAGLLYNPRYNIRLSSRYLRGLLSEFAGDPEEAIAAYNAGDVRVKEWLQNGKYRDSAEFVESIPFSDTRAYVESVIRDASVYQRILTGTANFTAQRVQEN